MRHRQGTEADPPGIAPAPNKPPELTRTHKALIGVVAVGAVMIAAIGFAGSFGAVRDLAEKKEFGAFAPFFPIGVDAGIVVLLALDLLLTWLRIPFPLLRQTAWLLTAATIAFNGAAAWPDALGVGMHAVIPVLFVVAVEAARHAVGRIADITADKHMDGVRLSRWLLAFPSTFKLWRRMKLWELRSYDEVIRMEQDRLVYEARLQAKFGRNWRRRAPVESLMPLKLARYGVPLAETASSGLAAAGIEAPELRHLEGREDRRELPSGATLSSTEELDEAPAVDEWESWIPEQQPEPELERTDLYVPEPSFATAGAVSAARNDGQAYGATARLDYTPEPTPRYEAAPEPEFVSQPEPAPEPELTGADLLEHRFLQLPAQERRTSASELARRFHKEAGFTEGTARKYLKPIKEKYGA